MVTAYDIIFFWVSRMIFQGLEFMGTKPFDKCLIHGLIRDPYGKKMSKSAGNGVDPIDVIEKYGVDALRYFLTTSTSPGLDTRYSEEKINAANNYLNKIWNASRFILLNLTEEDTEDNLHIDYSKLDVVDKYILTKLETTIQNVTSNMEKYDFANASTHLYNFVYDDFTSWYVELCKVKLNGEDKELKQNTKAVLIKVLKDIILMIYPYTPFIAEEIYLALPGHKESIMLDSYPEYDESLVYEEESKIIEDLIHMIKDIRAYKVENNLAPNAKVKLTLVPSTSLDEELFKTYLTRFGFASEVNVASSGEGEVKVYGVGQLIIEDNVNKEELLLKIEKEIARLTSEVNRGEKMLSNPNFLAKAPQAKIDQETNKLNAYKAELQTYLDKKAKL